jgi:G3E family GTPase
MRRHVAVDVVTGFLGSGKTTLLRHALARGLRDQRIALIVNEVGEVGIDGRAVTGLQGVERMVELASGCICCSIEEVRFDVAIQEIVAHGRPDLIVIESTGLADPEPLTERVRAAGLHLDAIITVVDVLHVARFLRETEVAGAQIAAADFLVLSKVDLVDAAAVAAVGEDLARRNGRALQIRSVQGAVDSEVLFATGVAAYRPAAGGGPSAHLARDGFEAFAYRGARPLDPDAFERFLDALPASVVRAKGIMRLRERDGHSLFNVVCGRVETSWLQAPAGDLGSQAVFIGRDVARSRDAVLAALRACER